MQFLGQVKSFRLPAFHQLMLHFSKLFLHFFTLGNILDHTDRELGIAFRIPNQRYSEMAPHHLAVLAEIALLHSIELTFTFR